MFLESTILLKKGPVNLACDFNDNLCSWSQEHAKSTSVWSFNNLKVKEIGQNGFQNISSSRYIYLNSLRQSYQKQRAILVSPLIQVGKPYSFCFK